MEYVLIPNPLVVITEARVCSPEIGGSCLGPVSAHGHRGYKSRAHMTRRELPRWSSSIPLSLLYNLVSVCHGVVGSKKVTLKWNFSSACVSFCEIFS